MKRDRILSALIAAVLAFMLSFGGVGCLITGFGLDGGSVAVLALVCCGASVGGALLARKKWGGALFLCLLALMFGFVWHSEDAREQIYSLLWHISDFYHRAYGWTAVQLGESGPGNLRAVGFPLGLLGSLVAVLISTTVVRRNNVIPAALTALLPLFACLVVTDTVPREGYLYILIFGILMLMLTGGLRRSSESQGNDLALLAAVPTALALGVLFLAVPQKSYVNKAVGFYDAVLSWAEQYPALMDHLTQDSQISSSGTGEKPQVDLRNTGPLLRRTYPVMEVSAQSGGIMYLRGQDYDFYNGTGWTATADRAEFFSGDFQGMVSQGTVTIATLRGRDSQYIPYYAAGSIKLMGGRVKNPGEGTVYDFALKTLPGNWRELVPEEITLEYAASRLSAGGGLDSRYLTLPNETGAWAAELLGSILTNEQSNTEKADAIAAWVRASAEYEANTPKMPMDRQDFARWFLEESETGYCVHFASATVVLLRAAGVPARYVTGYMFRTEAGVPVTVRADKAHAWAEYYEPGLGMWLVVESTPDDPEAPETTAPALPETDPSTDTTGSTQPDAPVTQPDDSAPGEDQQSPQTGNENSEKGFRLPGWLRTLGILLLWLVLGLAAVWGQRWLRLRLRRHKRRTGNSNSRALARWRELELLYRRLGETPPEELEALAQKARFSQHALTVSELQTLDAGLRTARSLCRKKSWPRRLIDQYFYAAY